MRADFVLDDKNHAADDHDQVGAPTHPRDEELHEEVGTRKPHCQFAQMPDLILPGCALCGFDRERQLLGE